MAQYTYEDDIDLRDLILKVWRGRWIIVGAVVVAAAVAFVYTTLTREPIYVAKVSMLPKTYALASGHELQPADYLPIFCRQSVLEKIATSYLSDASDTHEATSRLIDNALNVSIEVGKDQGTTPTALVVSMRHKDRATAIEMVREYIEVVQSEIASFASVLNNAELTTLEQNLKQRTDEYRAALDEQQAFIKTHDIETLRSRLSNRRSRLTAAEARVADLQSSIKVLTVSLEKGQAQLAKVDPLLVTRDVLDETYVKLVRQVSGDHDSSSIPNIERDNVNSVYTELLGTVLATERQLESAKTELANATNDVPALKAEIEALLGEIADAERMALELNIAVSRARSAYESAYAQYSSAVDIVRLENYTLAIVRDPWASTAPTGTSRLTTMALAAVLAAFVSVFGILFADYMRAGDRQASQIPTDTAAQ